MRHKRLKLFNFARPLERTIDHLTYCGSCWSRCVLRASPEWHLVVGPPEVLSAFAPSEEAQDSSAAGLVQLDGRGDAPLPEDVRTWRVADVRTFLSNIELSHVASKFTENSVDGALLLTLTDQDFQQLLGLSVLQTRKMRVKLREQGIAG
jgi:hypothetical protein